MKKATYIFIIIIFSISLSSFGQRKSSFDQPKKKTFEKSTFEKNNGPDKAGPPNPGGGGTGDPIPISGGFLLLSGGLFLYSVTRKKHKDA
jgi:hypothetical protein